MKQKQLHHEDVLFYHSLVQCCVALIVRSINGGPMLERETAQSEGMLNRCGTYMGVPYNILSTFLYVGNFS